MVHIILFKGPLLHVRVQIVLMIVLMQCLFVIRKYYRYEAEAEINASLGSILIVVFIII